MAHGCPARPGCARLAHLVLVLRVLADASRKREQQPRLHHLVAKYLGAHRVDEVPELLAFRLLKRNPGSAQSTLSSSQ